TVNVTCEVRPLELQQPRANVTLEHSSVGGVSWPHAEITANLADRRLTASVTGTFAQFDPHALGLTASTGNVAAGSVTASATISDVRAHIDATTVDADATI